jgi:hypothetical protein
MLTWRLALINGLVFEFGGPWLGVDGMPEKDGDGNDLPIKVGGIFFQPESSDTITDDDDDEQQPTAEGAEEESSDPNVTVEATPACFLVFAKPTKDGALAQSEETRVRRVFLNGNVLFSEEAWPNALAAEFIREEMSAELGRQKDALKQAHENLAQLYAQAQAAQQAQQSPQQPPQAPQAQRQ